MTRAFGVWVCGVVLLLVPTNLHRVAAPHPKTLRALSELSSDRIDSIPSERPAFRRGDAAGPFGWSTVIADFNTDGKPDVAVASQIFREASVSGFRLELLISDQPTEDITFESSHDFITIKADDVDGDDDLDIVVNTPLSGETIGVWLNDSQGHFTAADVQQVQPTIAPLASLGTADSSDSLATFETPPRQAEPARAAVFQTLIARSGHRHAVLSTFGPRTTLLSNGTIARAPPLSIRQRVVLALVG